jgi:magnesium and cobalt transporter
MSLFSKIKNYFQKFVSSPPVAAPVLHPIEEFLQTPVEEIMIPRSDIIAISSHSSFEEVITTFLKTGLKWLPVFRETLDTITGTVGIHCVLSLRESNTPEPRWNRHMNAPAFCPPCITVYEALHLIERDHKNTVLFVVDEYGGIEGMLTKGHLVKELFHRYTDDFTEEDQEMIISREPNLIINGRMDLEMFEEEFKTETLFNEDEENRLNTVGGWICSYLGRVPLTGEVISHPSGFTFEIREATPRKIHHIAILHMPINE